jgi:hypothetical protein
MNEAPAIILQTELQYFEEHRLQLLEQAPGKYALVKGSDLAGVFDSESEAVGVGYRRFGNDAFLVKHIVEAELPLTFATFNLGL